MDTLTGALGTLMRWSRPQRRPQAPPPPPFSGSARHPFLFRVQMLVQMGLKKKNEGQISHGPKGLLVRQQVILPDSVSSKQARSDAGLFEMERNRKWELCPPPPVLALC